MAPDKSLCHLGLAPNPCAWDHKGELMIDAAAISADAKRWRALRALPRDLNGKLYLLYRQALEECDDGEIPENPLALLDLEENSFYALADRAGIQRSYKYRIYRQLHGTASASIDAVMPQDPEVTEPADSPAPSMSRRRNGTKMAELLSVQPPRTTALYRWYDEADLLLYVGISDELTGRVSAHVDGSSWMDFAARSTITRYADRDEAAATEIEAIKTERPLFNQVHNNSPEARRRLVEYLVEHDRLDLLAPAVSRR